MEALKIVRFIPPRSNRKTPRDYDTHLYKDRHLAECCVGKLKHFRSIFSRFTAMWLGPFGRCGIFCTMRYRRCQSAVEQSWDSLQAAQKTYEFPEVAQGIGFDKCPGRPTNDFNELRDARGAASQSNNQFFARPGARTCAAAASDRMTVTYTRSETGVGVVEMSGPLRSVSARAHDRLRQSRRV